MVVANNLEFMMELKKYIISKYKNEINPIRYTSNQTIIDVNEVKAMSNSYKTIDVILYSKYANQVYSDYIYNVD